MSCILRPWLIELPRLACGLCMVAPPGLALSGRRRVGPAGQRTGTAQRYHPVRGSERPPDHHLVARGGRRVRACFLFLALCCPDRRSQWHSTFGWTAHVQGLPGPGRGVGAPDRCSAAVVLVAVDVAVVVVLLARREVAMAILFAATLIAVTLGVDAIKDTVARARPPDPLVTAQGGSFPVGSCLPEHGELRAPRTVAWRSSASRAARIAAIVGAALLVFLIGCSRIALGVHYPTDVVAGWLGGIAVVAVVLAITTRLDLAAQDTVRRHAVPGRTGPLG